MLFDAVASLGDRAEAVYLVGGTVRDILLGEEGFDIDIAVEGDAIEFARSLAAALGGRITPHRKFGTAIVLYGEGDRIDVVTTRTEFYDAPGRSRRRERAGLREDLFRRDFTINAMAVTLEPASFGRLFDPFGGRVDLAGVLLRCSTTSRSSTTRRGSSARSGTRRGTGFGSRSTRRSSHAAASTWASWEICRRLVSGTSCTRFSRTLAPSAESSASASSGQIARSILVSARMRTPLRCSSARSSFATSWKSTFRPGASVSRCSGET